MKKVRFVAPLAALATVAVVVAAARGHGCRRSGKQHAGYSAGLVSDVGRFNDKGFNQNQLIGPEVRAGAHPGPADDARSSRTRPATTCRTSRRSRARAYNIIIGAGLPARGRRRRRSRSSSRTRSSRSPTTTSTVAPFNGKKSPNVEGLTYATQENCYLVGCLAGLMAKKQGGNTDHRRRRRRQDPAGRHVPRRLPGRRGEVRPGHQGARSATRRTSSTRPSARRSRRTRSTRARRSCSRRRPVRPRRARRGEGGRRLGRRRRRRPVATSARTS